MDFEIDIPDIFMPIGVALVGWHFGEELGAGLAMVGLWMAGIALHRLASWRRWRRSPAGRSRRR